MSLPKNGAGVHFILSDSVLNFHRRSKLDPYHQTPPTSRLSRWRNPALSLADLSQHHQILPHFPAAVLDRVERLWVHQAGQLDRIDPIIYCAYDSCAYDVSTPPLPGVGPASFVPATPNDLPHPCRVCPHLNHYARRIHPFEESGQILLRRPQLPSVSVSPSSPKMQ
jgi:hypothetical protein